MDVVVFVDYKVYGFLIRRRADPKVVHALMDINVDGCGTVYKFLYNPMTGVLIIPRGNKCWETIEKALETVRELRRGTRVACVAVITLVENEF